MDREVIIAADNVAKRFCRKLRKSLVYGVQDVLCEFVGINREGKGLRSEEFWANDGVSFDVRRGECLGLIGHNGAGKTTLLKMLNGLIKPDRGRIEIKGRVGALIALGAGFNPILTGRENVYIAGSVLGLSKREIHEKYEEIVDFAELEEFMESPVQSYSSGMQVRLGFAVATALKTDILLIDEVLAVGDFNFRQKCLKRIRTFLGGDGAAILVSHAMDQIQAVCSRVLYLEKGKTRSCGDPKEAIELYFKDRLSDVREARPMDSEFEVDVDLVSPSGGVVETHSPATFEVRVLSKRDLPRAALHLVCLTRDQSVRIGSMASPADQPMSLRKGGNIVRFRVGSMPLLAGSYAIRTNIIDLRDGATVFNKGAESQADYVEVTELRSQRDFAKTARNEILAFEGSWHAEEADA